MRLAMSWQSAVRWVGSGVLVTGLSVGLAGCEDPDRVEKAGPPEPPATEVVHQGVAYVDKLGCNRMTGRTYLFREIEWAAETYVYLNRNVRTGETGYEIGLEFDGEQVQPRKACAPLAACKTEADKMAQDYADRRVRSQKEECRKAYEDRHDRSGGQGQP